MGSEYIAAICGLAGAVIGAMSVAIVTYITQRQETRRRLVSSLVAAGLEQWKEYFAAYKSGHIRQGSALYPPEVYIFHIAQFASLVEKAGSISDAELAKEIRSYFAKINLITHECQIADAARKTAPETCNTGDIASKYGY